ncbi:hypothetical protein J6590_013069 [Homalodisca vitripennis]|nr:hypothetical protein J6590_013069 [Homalodisca vitripennis]
MAIPSLAYSLRSLISLAGSPAIIIPTCPSWCVSKLRCKVTKPFHLYTRFLLKRQFSKHPRFGVSFFSVLPPSFDVENALSVALLSRVSAHISHTDRVYNRLEQLPFTRHRYAYIFYQLGQRDECEVGIKRHAEIRHSPLHLNDLPVHPHLDDGLNPPSNEKYNLALLRCQSKAVLSSSGQYWQHDLVIVKGPCSDDRCTRPIGSRIGQLCHPHGVGRNVEIIPQSTC